MGLRTLYGRAAYWLIAPIVEEARRRSAVLVSNDVASDAAAFEITHAFEPLSRAPADGALTAAFAALRR